MMKTSQPTTVPPAMSASAVPTATATAAQAAAQPMQPYSEQPQVTVSTTPSMNTATSIGEPAGGQQANSVPTDSMPPISGSGKTTNKWLLPVVGAAAVLALIAGGYVFGVYLPNRPEAVYKSSMSRSAEAADKLIEYVKTQAEAEATAAFMDGKLMVDSAGGSFDATMKGKSDAANSELNIAANVGGEKVNIDMRMVDVAISDSPDMYFKVSGVSQLLSSVGLSGVSSLDNQWIAVDHTLLDTYKKQLGTATGAGANLGTLPTSEQISDAATKVQAVNKEYLFTSDTAKAVVVYKSFAGKDTVDDQTVNHYIVTANKANLKAYIDALGSALDGSKLDDWVVEKNDGKHVSELLDVGSIKQSIDDLDENATFDMNVNTKTKLVQSVTFSDKTGDNAGTFTFAQNYTSGDEYPFSIRMKRDSDNTDLTLGMKLNTKTNEVGMSLQGDVAENTVDMTATITPSKDKISITVPTGAKPATQVMKQLGLDQSVLGARTSIPSSLLNLNKL
ncbi:hypothetical protein JNM87_04195 [Candidatus Saccharibacteria bacterium]|nr:hypothetical protein [Candidatus Saccharibacteria bacterium]